MPPTEKSILTNFLLPPAPLSTVITQKKFTELFPRTLQGNPAVGALYRELQHQRALGIDQVARSIEGEVHRGERQARQVAKERILSEHVELDDIDETELRLEQSLYGDNGPNRPDLHSIESIVSSLEHACQSVEEEIHVLDKEADQLLQNIQTATSDLSDLRYGRFPTTVSGEELGSSVFTTLKRLESVCGDATANKTDG
ncbi:hypothetical protein P152DRAFT_404046 [Eremomyces bilateralis CBS 781.70]|uniref:Cnl2/NKP2 family protein-domain-containing protein n=1 Tax=Eremomyces bilateralis CBS 781.70 TaxID=1392243 RepID=A0A6G1FTV8_9PEZI|nr:uncharacterized protein P152DRAFT_404046 [Eremomyces bilateralis CBS 781.70]KAF1809101.1 hypothetical protein P152DRAFT_404046 [Eremomyces bilateralis CBS 781.70]